MALAACLAAILADASQEKVFDNNYAEAAAWCFFQQHETWPTNITDLVSISKEHLRAFKREDYRSIDFKVLANGKLQLVLTAPSGQTETRLCDKPPTEATTVIKRDGYLIVHDGSSFYYLGNDGWFCSGPLDSMCGRAIVDGHYEVIAPWSFRAAGTLRYFNRPHRPCHCELSFEINLVERDGAPFNALNLAGFTLAKDKGKQKIPANPVFHKAYFAFSRLTSSENEK